MSGRVVMLESLDERLPALRGGIDSTAFALRLADTVDPCLGFSSPAVSVELLKHWPGKRCTVRLRLVEDTAELAVVAKTYARAEFAPLVDRTTRALRGVLHEPMVVPRPFGVIDGFALQEDRRGHELGATRTLSGEPFALLGRWLADLHSSSIVDGLRVKTACDETARMAGCIDLLERVADVDLDPLRHRLGPGSEDRWSPTAMIHRDFHPGNVLWDGQHVTVIDFDWLAVGDPAADVGGFVAQLEKRAMFTGRTWLGPEAAARPFVSAYLASRGLDSLPHMDEATASAFVNLAADEVKRQSNEHWKERAGRLSARALEVLDEGTVW